MRFSGLKTNGHRSRKSFDARIANINMILVNALRSEWIGMMIGFAQMEKGGMTMADRPKRKVEFIESYWTGGELGSDYQWNDNHGELVRCKDCKHYRDGFCYNPNTYDDEKTRGNTTPNWFCGDGERKDDDA